MTNDNTVRTISNSKLKGIMKGEEDDVETIDIRPPRVIGADFENLIHEMKSMLDGDLVRKA